MDGLPADGLQDIRQLRRDVVQAQKTAGSRPPLTRASKGWALGSMEAPDTDELGEDDVHIYASGGQLRVASQGSDIALGEVPFGPSVAIVPNMDSGTIGGAPTMAQYNNLYNDARAIRETLNELLGVLRGGQFPS